MITDRKLKSVKAKDKEYSLSDKDGLSLRIFPHGRKSFQYRYKLTGWKSYKRYVYGDYPKISLKQARQLHAEALKKVKAGIDLNLDKKTKIQKRIAEPIIQKAFEEYKEKYLFKELKRPEKQIYYFNKDILPAIALMKVKDVTRRHLIKILDNIVKRGAPVNANRTLSALKRFFGFCVERGMLNDNPALQITKKAVGGTETPKNRFLSENEIKTFWEKIDEAPFSRQVQLALKILMLTGQRVGELCNSEWSEIDMKKQVWIVPADKSKNGDENKVPLSNIAIECFSELKKMSGNSRFVLQSPQLKDMEKPIVYTTVNRAVLRHQEYFELEKWTPHDLRRTLATQLNELGVLPHVVEKILNHKMQGVMAVYNQAEYWEDKVKALNLWAERIKQIVAGKKVLKLRRKRA
jgi:integrase